jgi:hypothetical protein
MGDRASLLKPVAVLAQKQASTQGVSPLATYAF